ncbi:hypothetical protein Avbf_13184 [Armadillidium vulgare]|nr:hypothetical protein Avbf_13184 [Armadillidium vulgare]
MAATIKVERDVEFVEFPTTTTHNNLKEETIPDITSTSTLEENYELNFFPLIENCVRDKRSDAEALVNNHQNFGYSIFLNNWNNETRKQIPVLLSNWVTDVGIPTGSTSPPPSPYIEQNLSKHNPECSSESRSTETGIKIIINSRYKCDDCDLQTKSTDIFIQHLFKEHIRKIIIKPEKSLSQKPTRHWPKIYYCCYCDFEGKIIKEMRWHIFEHFRFRCSVCSLECTNIESLHKHIVIHEDDRFKCSLCRYKGKSRSDIKMHMVEHTDKNEVVVCDKCGKKVRKRSLTIHLVKVHKLKFIKCLDCTLKFLTEEEFEIHFEKRHLGSCFVESIDHRTKRIGTKIFSCSNCLFKTKNERDFKLHQLKERFFSNGNRKLKKEKLRQFYSEKEKLEYLWCYIYATNENVKNKNFWNRIETLIDKRKIAESIKLEFLPVEWRLKLLNEWKSSFATKVSLFEKEVDAHILRCLKDSAPFRIRMSEYYVGRKIQTVEDLLEVLYCYLFTFHKVFPKPYRKNRMRILLYKRGIIDRIKIDNKTNNCLVNVARSVLKGKTPITVEQIKDVKRKINEILVSALKSEDGDCSNYEVYYYENSDKELVLNKRNDKVLERDQNDIDMALKRDYKTRQVKELEPVSPDCLNTKGNIGKNAGPDVQETVILSVNASDSEAKANGSYIPKEEPSDIDIKLETLDDIDMKLGTMDAIIDTLVDISPESMKIINLISGQIITEIKSDYLDDTSEGTIEIMDLELGSDIDQCKI